jgi:hypothetical protein
MFLVALACLVGFGADARAATINSNTIAFDFLTNGGASSGCCLDGNQNDQFTQFNPALGTLTGVTIMGGNGAASIVLTMNIEADLNQSDATGLEQGESVFGDYLLNLFYTLPGGLTNEFDSLFDDGFGCTAESVEVPNCDQQTTKSSQQGVIPNTSSVPTDLSPYIGTSTVLLQLETEADVSVDAATTATLNGAFPPLFFDSTEASGNLFLQYTYTPITSQTPEPTSLALIAGGLALIGLGRYGRKKPR